MKQADNYRLISQTNRLINNTFNNRNNMTPFEKLNNYNHEKTIHFNLINNNVNLNFKVTIISFSNCIYMFLFSFVFHFIFLNLRIIL